MKVMYLAGALAIISPVLAAEIEPLPPDVVSYLERSAPCRMPAQGSTSAETLANLIELMKSEECVEFQRERNTLVQRYKDNQRVLNALIVKIGFVGNETYSPESK